LWNIAGLDAGEQAHGMAVADRAEKGIAVFRADPSPLHEDVALVRAVVVADGEEVEGSQAFW
jgi:hypothetical protein